MGYFDDMEDIRHQRYLDRCNPGRHRRRTPRTHHPAGCGVRVRLVDTIDEVTCQGCKDALNDPRIPRTPEQHAYVAECLASEDGFLAAMDLHRAGASVRDLLPAMRALVQRGGRAGALWITPAGDEILKIRNSMVSQWLADEVRPVMEDVGIA